MRRAWTLAAAAATLTCAVSASSASAPPVGAPTAEHPYAARLRMQRVHVYDGRLHQLGSTLGQWTTAGGNGSEVLVRATNSGRLAEFGGSVPYVSSDAGRSWRQVQIPVPTLLDGEGTIVAGHGDQLFGVGWMPYGGDRLQTARDDRETGWMLGAAPVHTPLYDRPWLTYAQGPFTMDGTRTDFVTVIHGGSNAKDSSTLISTDGLTYLPSFPAQDASGGAPSPFTIRVVRNPDADQWQPSPYAYTVPLSGGGVLLLRNPDDGFACPAMELEPSSGHWRCVGLAFTPTGTVRQDSRGWLTMLSEDSDGDNSAFRLSLSPDGGRTWRSVLMTAPHGGRFEGSFHYDVIANGRLGQAVVASRFLDAKGRGQDLVWRIDIGSFQPKVSRVYEVGRGDDVAPSGADVSKATASVDRVDFPTVALLPDGRIACSFTDSSTPNGDDNAPPSNLHSPAVIVIDSH